MVLSVLLFWSSATVQAAPATDPVLTQLDYLKLLVQLSGETGTFNSAEDYVKWAQAHGMTPAGGWQVGALLTKDVMAQTLVQYLNLAPAAGTSDYLRVLVRAGIELPDQGQITRSGFVSVVDDFGFQSRASRIVRTKHTVHDPSRVPLPGVPPPPSPLPDGGSR